jgi:hypothetical protein
VAGVSSAEISKAVQMAEKVRQVRLVNAGNFSKKVKELLAELDNG